MWRWIRHWVDWLRNDRLPLARMRRGWSIAAIRHETVGGMRDELPVPWSADAVIVEVQLHLPPPARRKSDFTFRFPHADPVPADALRAEQRERHRISFRFPTPLVSTEGEVLWKRQPVARVSVPILTADEFLNGMSLTGTSLCARRETEIIPARSFVPDARTGLVATTLLSSAYPLAPLARIGISVIFHSQRSGRSWEVAIPLTAQQRLSRSAILSAACPSRPRRPGLWTATWRVGGRDLATHSAEAVPARRLEDSIRVVDARFVVADKTGSLRIVRQIPAAASIDRLGPCFFVSSAEAGAVGCCALSVFATPSGEGEGAHLQTQDVLITDAPTAFAPGLYSTADMARTGGFELRLSKRVLGTISLSPVPSATLTSEGGFKPPPNFTWTVTAEEELLDRLGRLGHSNG